MGKTIRTDVIVVGAGVAGLAAKDFWKRRDRILSRMSASRDPDRSFHEFLAANPGGATSTGTFIAKATIIQGSDLDVSVCWTLAPQRAPMLVAWAGGRRGAALAMLSVEERRDGAIASAARMFGLSRAKLASLLVDDWTHDREEEPFARGAYSYPLACGSGAGRTLARPIRITLYIAGEATVEKADSVTMHGAMRSGHRAATQLARHFGALA